MKSLDAHGILEKLRRMPVPADPEKFHLTPLAANASLGLFGNGLPVIFFELPVAEKGTSRTSARGVEAIVSSRFEVTERRNRQPRIRSGYAIVLRDPGLLEIFAAVAAHVASRLGTGPTAFATQTDVDRYFAEWSKFFASEALSVERAVGLWGELYVLSVLPNLERGVACWVGPYGKMFDFMGNGVSLEVKTALRTAVASFSLDQIEGRDMGHSIILRVLRDDANGSSVDELVSQTRARLPDSVQFDSTLVRTLYRPGANADVKLTAEDVRAIPNVKVPRPVVSDTRIRAVRFEVDMDSLEGAFVRAEPLFKRMTRSVPAR
jgi:hypothetical protein